VWDDFDQDHDGEIHIEVLQRWLEEYANYIIPEQDIEYLYSSLSCRGREWMLSRDLWLKNMSDYLPEHNIGWNRKWRWYPWARTSDQPCGNHSLR